MKKFFQCSVFLFLVFLVTSCLFESEGEQVTIHYESDIGISPSDILVQKTKTVEGDHYFPVLIEDGYEFLGWEKDSIIITELKPEEDITLIAKWKRLPWVYYDSNGGSGTMDATRTNISSNGAAILKSNSFEAPYGKRFAYWSREKEEAYNPGDNVTITQDTTFYAIWNTIGGASSDVNLDSKTHRIVYFYNVSSSEIENGNSEIFSELDDVSLFNIALEGYTFAGWYEDSAFTGSPITSWEAGTYTSDVILYAKFVCNHTLTIFDSDEIVYTQNFSEDDIISLSPIIKSSYDFLGFYENEDFTGVTIDGWNPGEKRVDVTLYAKYKKYFSITYENSTGFDNPNPIKFYIDESVTLLDLETEYSAFFGWYTDSNFSGSPITGWAAGDKNTDIILYARILTSIPKDYWGYWIQMDTGDLYYINSEEVKKKSGSSYTTYLDNINGWTIDSENVLRYDDKVYFRKGGSNRDFSLSVSGFSDSTSRSASTRVLNAQRSNPANTLDKEIIPIDSTGIVSFTGAVAEDSQTISIKDSEFNSYGSINVTPKYNGENIGTIPVVENGSYGFKTTYTIDADDQGFCYGNYFKSYSVSLSLKNIGTANCSTSFYEISCEDSNLSFVNGSLEGNFSTINAGETKTINLGVTYGKLDLAYVDVPINISITDSKYGRTWDDSITIRFYKGMVGFKINSRNFDSSSSAKLNGFFIYPDGRSRRFTVSAGSVEIINLPWSEDDYTLAFSGATSTNEMAYSFGFAKTTSLADLSGVWKIDEINGYEPNDSVSEASAIVDLSVPVKAYLKDADIDFYTINCSDIDIGFAPATYNSKAISDGTPLGIYNNGDGYYNPGEVIQMDIRLHNNTGVTINDITSVLSTESEYITFETDTIEYGNISSGYYKTAYDSKLATTNSGFSSTSGYGSCSYLSASSGYKFTISEETPFDTEIPFTLTFTDVSGNEWKDSFSITVEKTKAEIVYNSSSKLDNTSLGTYNNGDGYYNPGEVIQMDIRLQNTGSSLAQSITSVLSTESEYITFETDTIEYGNITSEYYKTAYDSQLTTTNSGFSSISGYGSCSYLSASSGYKFTISEETPFDTEIPFTLTFTDVSGNEWTDSFSITVEKTKAEIVYSARTISDSTSLGTYNNGDGYYNPGEVIQMDIRLQNTGSSLAQSITTVLSTESEYITFETDTIEYGNITSGYYKTAYDSKLATTNSGFSSTSGYGSNSQLSASSGYKFTISEETPFDTEIPFTLTFTDVSGNEWTDSFSITVEKTKVSFSTSYSWSDATSISSNNNDDGSINPGEKINFDIRLRNTGLVTASNIVARLTSTSPYITFTDNISNYGNIAAGNYKTSYALSGTGYSSESSASYSLVSNPGYIFTISSSTPSFTEIPISVTYTDTQNNVWTDSINLLVVNSYVNFAYIDYVLSDNFISGTLNDNDGFIEGGEQISLDFIIKNTGTSRAKSVSVTLSTTSPYVSSFTNSNKSYGTMGQNCYKSSYSVRENSSSLGVTNVANIVTSLDSYPACRFIVSPSTPVGTVIPINMIITDSTGETWTYVINLETK